MNNFNYNLTSFLIFLLTILYELYLNIEQIYDTKLAGVDVRIYEPTKGKNSDRPALVYYHGGGWSWLSIGKHSF